MLSCQPVDHVFRCLCIPAFPIRAQCLRLRTSSAMKLFGSSNIFLLLCAPSPLLFNVPEDREQDVSHNISFANTTVSIYTTPRTPSETCTPTKTEGSWCHVLHLHGTIIRNYSFKTIIPKYVADTLRRTALHRLQECIFQHRPSVSKV